MPRSQMSFLVRVRPLGVKGKTKDVLVCKKVQTRLILTDICNSSMQDEYLHLQKTQNFFFLFLRALLIAFRSMRCKSLMKLRENDKLVYAERP